LYCNKILILVYFYFIKLFLGDYIKYLFKDTHVISLIHIFLFYHNFLLFSLIPIFFFLERIPNYLIISHFHFLSFIFLLSTKQSANMIETYLSLFFSGTKICFYFSQGSGLVNFHRLRWVFPLKLFFFFYEEIKMEFIKITMSPAPDQHKWC